MQDVSSLTSFITITFQLTMGMFADLYTLQVCMNYVEISQRSFLLLYDTPQAPFLNMLLLGFLYLIALVALLWLIYKCFVFLRARSAHDEMRRQEMEREKRSLLMQANRNPDENIRQFSLSTPVSPLLDPETQPMLSPLEDTLQNAEAEETEKEVAMTNGKLGNVVIEEIAEEAEKVHVIERSADNEEMVVVEDSEKLAH